ncbi:pyridoxamine 5'-phosphate oxidase family protein [Amycolatopsis thermophila]|uniref:Hemerythrin n=1 Tax=Amycolatopsis thermophila TaxID=206084 RepID=A0ABU0F0N9_9PSEU|nr:hypothetical protein [Amycolatopsis thermophila]MDQ0381071.1 hypothetical protein [Amycolatopsis thermophila]
MTTEATGLSWPAILDQATAYVTTEYASLTRAGTPVTWPVTPYRGEERETIDVSTGLTYPLKAERARRNPRVALSFSHPLGSGLDSPATFVVQGLATVRDADLRTNSARYLAVWAQRFPEVFRRTPEAALRRMAFYWTRIWIEVTPVRVLWWAGDLARPPEVWEPTTKLAVPPSDPPPHGRGAGSWNTDRGSDWRKRTEGAIDRLGLPVLTTVTADGWPLPLRVRAAERTADGFRLTPPAGVPIADGPAFMTFHSHAEVFDGQENIGLAGTCAVHGDEVHLTVDHALHDWGIPRNPLRNAIGMLRTGRRLRTRLATEAGRRDQAPPSFDDLR